MELPRGGGSVRGLGERFSTNPATGTAGLTVPLPASPARDGATPPLALTYDSGAAHGSFGLGWDIGLGAVSRATDKGLPRYTDDDVFALAGAGDDLVALGPADPRTVGGVRYRIDRYRPRVDGGYARIERWTADSGDVHWRTIDRENTTSFFGTSADARVADPADRRGRVFRWLVTGTVDDRGNATVYRYLREDGAGVDRSLSCERHRTDTDRSAARHLGSVAYGNTRSRFGPAADGSGLDGDDFLFELVFDYGQYPDASPTPAPVRPWPCRHDPHSSYRSGFEIRNLRLCRRILMFHHFPDEPEVGADCLVRSMRLEYAARPGADDDRVLGHPDGAQLVRVTTTGHRRAADGYASVDLPALALAYSTAAPGDVVHELDDASLADLPSGVDGRDRQWVDLDGVGPAGVLVTAAGAWYLKSNEGGARLGPARPAPDQPSVPLGPGRLLDVDADGREELVVLAGPTPGAFHRADGSWSGSRPFRSLPVLDWDDPDLRFTDVTGDGWADALRTTGDEIVWYPSLGADGWGPPRRVPVPTDPDDGPRVLFSDATQAVLLADMSGDGQADVVRVRDGDVRYWPNLGFGRFGRCVVMDGAPRLGGRDGFDPRRVRLADVARTGPADLVHLGPDGVTIHPNRLGDGFGEPIAVPALPAVRDLTHVEVTDLLGTGTAVLVWSSPLPGDVGRQVRYVDLMGTKPNLLVRVENGVGTRTSISYASSTVLALRDRAAGDPWASTPPFPVHVVEEVVTEDRVARTRYSTRYRYRDGHYDRRDREFRGFAMVERVDTEDVAALAGADRLPAANEDPAFRLPPVRTRTWFHTGSPTVSGARFYPPPDLAVPEALDWLVGDPDLPPDLEPERAPEAWRALKGRMLREEVYADDGSERQRHPYTVVAHGYTVRVLAAPTPHRYGVFAVDARETLTVACERRPEDPRVVQEAVLEVDEFGTPVHTVMLAFRRGRPDPELPEITRAVQATTLVTETRSATTEPVDTDDDRRLPVPYDVTVSHLTGTTTGPDVLDLDGATARIRPDRLEVLRASTPPPGLDRTVVGRSRTRFLAADLVTPADWGVQGPRGLVAAVYRLAMTDALCAEVFGDRVDDALLGEAGLVAGADVTGRWVPSGTVRAAPPDIADADVASYAAAHFFRPRRHVDPFGGTVDVTDDRYDLLPVHTVDATGNTVELSVDYRVLAPVAMTDANGNRTTVTHDTRGLVVASAVEGKPTDPTGDAVPVSGLDLTADEIAAFWADPDAAAPGLLGDATTRFVYDLDSYVSTADRAGGPRPVGVAVLNRERHTAEGPVGAPQVSFSYRDGAGREIQRKIPCEPEGTTRWVADGWTVLDNKGLPVRRYEPFRTTTHEFEFAVRAGVSAVLLHDPLGRLLVTLYPDHTYDKTVVVDAWRQDAWDAGDTAAHAHPSGAVGDPADDPDVGHLVRPVPVADRFPTWFARRIDGDLGEPARTAAERSRLYAGTPTTTATDPLGRTVLTLARNRTPSPAGPVADEQRTHTTLDLAGNRVALADGAGPGGATRTLTRFRHDLAGRVLLEEGVDTAPRRTLTDAAGRPLVTWEVVADGGAEQRHEYRYDMLRRPVEVRLIRDGQVAVVGRTAYGETVVGAEQDNLRGRVQVSQDGAGAVTFAYDVHGREVSRTRTFCAGHRGVVDWSASPELLGESWTTRTRFDVLDRPVELTHPDGTTVRYAYDRGRRATHVEATPAGDPGPTVFVDGIDYDAKGQPTRIRRGNGTTVVRTYDDATFRLTGQTTTRAGHPEDSPVPPDVRNGAQNLTYVHDPMGNVVRITDLAQPTVFTLNTQVSADLDHTYDALYRLVAAEGREHRADDPTPWSPDDAARVAPTDRQALGRYRETFTYDGAGNLELVHHTALTGPGGWSRQFTHAEPSLLEPGPAGNRLSTSVTSHGGDVTETYHHDPSGCMDLLPPFSVVRWDHRHRLAATATQATGPHLVPETTWYVYDDSGTRARWVTDASTPVGDERRVRQERLYLDGFEVYRAFGAGAAVSSERTTVHVMVGETRIALVETRTDVPRSDPGRTLVRHQYVDHLGSTTLELDGDGGFVSYEQFYTYGCSALQFWRSGAPPQRYRFTGQERDATGLTYHGARYYAPWLGRWTSSDPAGVDAGPNTYWYAAANPLRLVDATGLDVRDTAGACFVSAVDTLFNTRMDSFDLMPHSDTFVKNYERCDWGRAISDAGRPTRQWMKGHPTIESAAGAALGVMSVVHPNPPRADDLPETMQESYAALQWATTQAATVMSAVKAVPRPGGGSPPRPHLQTAPAGASVSAVAATAERATAPGPGVLLMAAAGRGQKNAPSRPGNGDGPRDLEVGDVHPQTGEKILAVVEDPVDLAIESAKPSQKGALKPKVYLGDQAHHRSGFPHKSVAPPGEVQAELFRDSVPQGKGRYALDAAGNVHQFHSEIEGLFHWSGQGNGRLPSGEVVGIAGEEQLRTMLLKAQRLRAGGTTR